MNGRPDIVLLHGAGGGAWEWRNWIDVLVSYGWDLAAPDLQPVPEGLTSTRVEDYLRQVREVMLAHERVVLIGASMGGLLAMKAAETRTPEALVLVNSVPPAGTPGWPARDVRFPPVIPWANGSLESTRENLPDADEDTVRWAHSRWRDESGAVMRALYAGVPLNPPSVPTLVINGIGDEEVPPETGLALAERFEADLMQFIGVSHVGALLGWRAQGIAELTANWLEQVLAE